MLFGVLGIPMMGRLVKISIRPKLTVLKHVRSCENSIVICLPA